MIQPRNKASQVLKDLEIQNAETLRFLPEICWERGAFVKESPLEGAEGRLVVSGDKGVITVPKGLETRKRFSIAHELGHFEMHREEQAVWNCSSSQMSDWSHVPLVRNLEREANEFAAEFLMPELFLKTELRGTPPSLDFLKSLAQRYWVSLSALSIRYTQLANEPCSIIFTRENQSPQILTTKAFENTTLRFKGELPFREQKAMKEVNPKDWIESEFEGSLYMSSEYFKNYQFGISLFWVA